LLEDFPRQAIAHILTMADASRKCRIFNLDDVEAPIWAEPGENFAASQFVPFLVRLQRLGIEITSLGVQQVRILLPKIVPPGNMAWELKNLAAYGSVSLVGHVFSNFNLYSPEAGIA
jgi:hypothetical protein